MSSLPRLLTAGAVTLGLAAALAGGMAHSQVPNPDQATMPPSCRAAWGQLENRFSTITPPPSTANMVVQTQHGGYLIGMVLETLDGNCRDWSGYQQTRNSYQASLDGLVRSCEMQTTDPSVCRVRRAYGR